MDKWISTKDRLPEAPQEDNGKTFDMRHEYIRKVDVVDALNELYSKLGRRADKLVVQEILYDDILPYVRQDSRNDVEEVKHGHWICHADAGVTECSVCHNSVSEYVEYPRCMFCGAKMDEEENDGGIYQQKGNA